MFGIGINPIQRWEAFPSTTTLAKDGTDSATWDMSKFAKPQGAFCVYVACSGTGTLLVQFATSGDGVNYVTDPTNVVAAQASDDAWYAYSIQPKVGTHLKIIITENDVNPLTAVTVVVNCN